MAITSQEFKQANARGKSLKANTPGATSFGRSTEIKSRQVSESESDKSRMQSTHDHKVAGGAKGWPAKNVDQERPEGS